MDSNSSDLLGYLNLSEQQVQSIKRTLVRLSLMPESLKESSLEEFLEWCRSEGKIQTMRMVATQMAQVEPHRRDLPINNLRAICFEALTGLDCFSLVKAKALEVLLFGIEQFPSLVSEPRRMNIIVRDMNQVHREEVEALWKRVDRAMQRFNDNSGLGRPVLSSFAILFDELVEIGVFNCTDRVPHDQQALRAFFLEHQVTLRQAKEGKSYSSRAITSIVEELERLLTTTFEAELRYWYNASMIKAYVRDTLIPNAILNGYLDPSTTTDHLGAIWRFIVDLNSEDQLLIFPTLLFHQPQLTGPRYATRDELQDELRRRELNPADYPALESLLEKRIASIRSSSDEGDSRVAPHVYPFLRITHGADFLGYLLSRLCEPSWASNTRISQWTQHSLFSIDPGAGIPSQALSAALRSLLFQPNRLETLDSDLEIPNRLDTTYHSIVTNKFGEVKLLVEKLKTTIATLNENDTDLYDVKQSLLDILMTDLIRSESDWREECAVANIFQAVCDLTVRLENSTEFLGKIDQFKTQMNETIEEFEETVLKLETRASQIRIDYCALMIWRTLVCDFVSRLNQLTTPMMISSQTDARHIFPINSQAFEELNTPDDQAQLNQNVRDIIQLVATHPHFDISSEIV